MRTAEARTQPTARALGLHRTQRKRLLDKYGLLPARTPSEPDSE